MNALNFIKVALKDYKVGAITISSRFVVNRVLKALPPGVKNVVEYGAGNGVITKEILKMLPSDGSLIAVELNKELLPLLESIRDKRLRVVAKDVAEFLEESRSGNRVPADAVVSGIPFTFFPPAKRRLIVDGTHGILSAGGEFVVYQYSLLMLPILKKKFRTARIGFEFRNLPPYFIMAAKK